MGWKEGMGQNGVEIYVGVGYNKILIWVGMFWVVRKDNTKENLWLFESEVRYWLDHNWKNVAGFEGICVTTPGVPGDSRGYFMEAYS